MVAGYVYVLVNETMPGLVKIGKTKRLPTDRSDQLYTTGVPKPFDVKFAIYSDDMDTLERTVHEELADYRVSTSREFFKIDSDDASIRVIDMFLSMFDHSAVHGDFVIDPGDHARYADVCGVVQQDVIQVINQFSIAAWKAASAKLSERRQQKNNMMR